MPGHSNRPAPYEMHALPAPLGWLLAAVVFSAFLTETKFLPGIKNNVGVFEVLGGLLVVCALAVVPMDRLRLHPLTKISLGMLVVAVASQVNISHNRMLAGLINVAILLFFFLFLAGSENLVRRYRIHPAHILRLIAWSLIIVGPWIILQGLDSDAGIQEAGPFRNRAHMGNYMLTAFWMVLGYSQVPELRLRERWVSYAGIAMSLYAVAVSGRRSVYLSLAVGMGVLLTAFLLANRQKRLGLAFGALFALGTLAGMYTWGPRAMPQLAFFQERVGMIDDRLRSAMVVEEEDVASQTFFEMQRQGVREAFEAHPLIGIGWGGYAKSHWSPDRHEVHSTPLRFLAETGLLGVVLYGLFMAVLWTTTLRTFLRLRKGPWGPVTFIFLVALSSLAVSYLYNRHVTERTFWLFTMTAVAFELALERRDARRRAAPRADAAHPLPAGTPATLRAK